MQEPENKIVNGVEVTTDGDITHFTIPNDGNQVPKDGIVIESKTPWYSRVFGWLKNHDFGLYVKYRDAADPFGDRDDFDRGCDGRGGVEAGLNFRF